MRARLMLGGFALVLVGGCVLRTEHKIEARITIDIRHIEQQADDILDFISGGEEGSAEKSPGGSSSLFLRVWQALDPLPAAYAEELKNTSPEVIEIAKKLRARNEQIEELKKKNCLGEDNRGYVEVRDCDYCKDPKNKNEAQKLKSAENDDRKALYKEIAKLNEDKNVPVSTVERVYAQKRLERAKPGEIFQLPPEGADFDAFKKSAAGQRLEGDCKPNAWVTIK